MVAPIKPERDYDKLSIRNVDFFMYEREEVFRRGMVIGWSWPGVGFGECTFCIDGGSWELETETLGEEFAQELLKKFCERFTITE